MKKPTVEVEQWVEVDRFLGRIRLEQPWARFLFVPSKPSGEPAAVSIGQVTHFYGRAGKAVDLFGHITDCEEIEELAQTGIDAVFICDPLYDGILTLPEALASAQGSGRSFGGPWAKVSSAGGGLLPPASYQKPQANPFGSPQIHPATPTPPPSAPARPAQSSLPLPPPPPRPAIPPVTRTATPPVIPKGSPWPWKKPK